MCKCHVPRWSFCLFIGRGSETHRHLSVVSHNRFVLNKPHCFARWQGTVRLYFKHKCFCQTDTAYTMCFRNTHACSMDLRTEYGPCDVISQPRSIDPSCISCTDLQLAQRFHGNHQIDR